VLAVLAVLAACASESESSCPADKPSGECDTVNLRCDYLDEQGCPHSYVCSVYNTSSGASWAEYGPLAGGPCSSPGQFCEYALETDTGEHHALECGPSGTWPSASLCPEQQPMAGSPCEHHLLSCWYDCHESTGKQMLAHCQFTWMISDLCAKAGG
jgi:hypothetical protein